ncbi:hypothetical protein GCM10009016_15610 [Halomonas beimenensis]
MAASSPKTICSANSAIATMKKGRATLWVSYLIAVILLASSEARIAGLPGVMGAGDKAKRGSFTHGRGGK